MLGLLSLLNECIPLNKHFFVLGAALIEFFQLFREFVQVCFDLVSTLFSISRQCLCNFLLIFARFKLFWNHFCKPLTAMKPMSRPLPTCMYSTYGIVPPRSRWLKPA